MFYFFIYIFTTFHKDIKKTKYCQIFEDIGTNFEPTTTAKAAIKTFFMIYCPSSVGTKKVCQAILGRKINGNIVVIR